MPIKIPDSLPARAVLEGEQIFVMTEHRAQHQDIRPLELLLLNLMPNKINTEIQYLRMLSNSPLQVNVRLLRIDYHLSRHTPQEHLDTFYVGFEEVRERYYDGMIVTGAPLDQKSFDVVNYWENLAEIIRWSSTHVTSTLFSCWGVAAALKIFYGAPMVERQDKLSGVFLQHTAPLSDTLIRGFDDSFLAPISRFIDFTPKYIKSYTELEILASGDESGVYLAISRDRRQVYVTGHPEYDAHTLADEYHRDLKAGRAPVLPQNYFPHDDPSREPRCTWRSHASMLFCNWLNYYVYQITPYELPAGSKQA